jgi:DivIVA domain-containing protein
MMNDKQPKASFPKSMRGYRVKQVDAYIEAICADFADAEEDYQSRIVALEKEIAHLLEQLQGYAALQAENAELRAELENCRKHRLRLIRKSAAGVQATPKASKPKLSEEQRKARTQHVFSTGAELVRIVGQAGKQVTRIVDALPATRAKNAASEKVASPANTKQAKALLHQLSKQEKMAKKTQQQIKKTAKAEKKLQKRVAKLTK